MNGSPGLPSIRQRLPSRSEALLLFIACAFAVNVWSILNLLRWMPSLLLDLQLPKILVIASYTQAFALFESIIVFLLLLLLGFLLPRGVFRDRWVAKGTVFLFLTALLVVSYHCIPTLLRAWSDLVILLNQFMKSSFSEVYLFALAILIYVTFCISTYLFLLRWSFIQTQKRDTFVCAIHGLLERLLVPTAIYLILDVLGGIIVLFRNLI